ncbi:MAG: Rpn family recombination-promoting nuclease/putative transposase [Fibrobacter sp.]|nr:Rpn family recombination-promoting nuclease/putative transposase [Fibrobacter sp.]
MNRKTKGRATRHSPVVNKRRNSVVNKRRKSAGEPRRKHDGFFKYVYTVPDNARAMLCTFSRHSKDLRKILKNVDLNTLEEIPERYDNVDEHGEADIAFRVEAAGGERYYFGILLEHKSEHKANVLEQTFRYAFNVMVDKTNPTFKWMPTKAIVIYNGTDDWDPLAEYRSTPHPKFNGKDLPFECAFIDLKRVSDELISLCESAEAAVGLFAMKYAFDVEAFSAALTEMEPLFRKMDPAKGATLVEKIKLYLGEFITEDVQRRLDMAFQSIGQKLGFVSAGDVRRARERAAEKRGEIRGEKRGEAKGREAALQKANSDFLQEKLEAARELLAEGLSIEKVCRIQKLTEAQVRSL